MNKRKLFGIVLFIVIGLFMFTFANPNEPVGEGTEQGSNQQEQAEEKNENTEQDTTEENIEEEITEETTDTTDDVVEQQPVIVPVVNGETENVIDLSNDKNQAKEEILNYSNGLLIGNEELKNQIINNSNELIDNAETKEEIDQIVEDAKNKLDELKEQENLENAINNAIEEIKNYTFMSNEEMKQQDYAIIKLKELLEENNGTND